MLTVSEYYGGKIILGKYANYHLFLWISSFLILLFYKFFKKIINTYMQAPQKCKNCWHRPE